jgi:hypothetical protein
MICQPRMSRRYDTRREAWCYLVGRGFSYRPFGDWENGRWTATVTHDRDGCDVMIWLRGQAEFSQIA